MSPFFSCFFTCCAGYMIPTPSGLMDPSSSASLLNGHTPVSAIGYIVIDHAMCAGDLTVEAVVSGEWQPSSLGGGPNLWLGPLDFDGLSGRGRALARA